MKAVKKRCESGNTTPMMTPRTIQSRRGFGSTGALSAAAGLGALGVACLAAAAQMGGGGVLAEFECVTESCNGIILMGEAARHPGARKCS